jgi:hypothetical protein
MTLGGLTLAIGILVDESTVAIENIHTHLARGKPRARAVLDVVSEVAVPMMLAMLCILAVFAPSFFMVGVGRALFVPLALSVGFAMAGLVHPGVDLRSHSLYVDRRDPSWCRGTRVLRQTARLVRSHRWHGRATAVGRAAGLPCGRGRRRLRDRRCVGDRNLPNCRFRPDPGPTTRTHRNARRAHRSHGAEGTRRHRSGCRTGECVGEPWVHRLATFELSSEHDLPLDQRSA